MSRNAESVPRVEKILLLAPEVWMALGECRTIFYGPTGSYHDPDFPAPIKRPGRAPQWLRADIEAFAAKLAERSRTAAVSADLAQPCAQRGRGRPRKPRPFADHADAPSPTT